MMNSLLSHRLLSRYKYVVMCDVIILYRLKSAGLLILNKRILSQLVKYLSTTIANTYICFSLYIWQAEQVSVAQLVDWIIIVSLGVLWFIIPIDAIALVTQYLYNKVFSVSSLILTPLPILGKDAWVSFHRVGAT